MIQSEYHLRFVQYITNVLSDALGVKAAVGCKMNDLRRFWCGLDFEGIAAVYSHM